MNTTATTFASARPRWIVAMARLVAAAAMLATTVAAPRVTHADRPKPTPQQRKTLQRAWPMAWKAIKRCPALRGGLSPRCVVLADSHVERGLVLLDVRELRSPACSGEPREAGLRLQSLELDVRRGRIWVADMEGDAPVLLRSRRGRLLCRDPMPPAEAGSGD